MSKEFPDTKNTDTRTAGPGFTDRTLAPGNFVRCPGQPDWGIGQVQSALGTKVTVNFENIGKVVVNTAVVILEPTTPGTPDRYENSPTRA